jgi:geranylgeranylglycerol-phosphate geranylgeranyltransferase
MLAQKLKGTLQIFRPELPFAAGVCVVLGEIIALGTFPSAPEILLGFLCGFFISGSATILNDYYDLEVDRINAPDRPIPAGIIGPAEALLLTRQDARNRQEVHAPNLSGRFIWYARFYRWQNDRVNF